MDLPLSRNQIRKGENVGAKANWNKCIDSVSLLLLNILWAAIKEDQYFILRYRH